MIPDIEQSSILAAIRKMNGEPVDTSRPSTGYDLVFEGKRYLENQLDFPNTIDA